MLQQAITKTFETNKRLKRLDKDYKEPNGHLL